jgi:ubiquitin-protein ligase
MSVRLRRLQAEYERLRLLFEGHPRIRIVETAGDPPDRYTIEYRLKGLVQEKDGIHVREVHRAKIMLGPNFPKEMPQCVMLTSVFHPNIDHLAICTEDIGAAGQTVDQLITFIGEMITYQAYNIQSPRNGEAAQWAREHAAEFPLERVNLTPSVLLEGGLTAPLAAKLAPASERCANCGAGGDLVLLRRCSGGHLACPECVLECANCRKLLCVSCELSTCFACRRVVCGDCVLACPGCGRAFCMEHIGRCAVCGRYECAACAGKCASATGPLEPPPLEPPPEPTLPDLPPEPIQVDPAPVSPAVAPEKADYAASSESPLADIPAGDASPAAAGAEQDGERTMHSILLTADEVASVPDSAIAHPPRYLRIEPELRKRPSGKAIAALVFAVVGTPLLGILLGWFAILFAALAKREFRANPALTGRSLATTALVLGIFDILLWAVLIAVYWRTQLHHAPPPSPLRTPHILSLFVMGIHP